MRPTPKATYGKEIRHEPKNPVQLQYSIQFEFLLWGRVAWKEEIKEDGNGSAIDVVIFRRNLTLQIAFFYDKSLKLWRFKKITSLMFNIQSFSDNYCRYLKYSPPTNETNKKRNNPFDFEEKYYCRRYSNLSEKREREREKNCNKFNWRDLMRLTSGKPQHRDIHASRYPRQFPKLLRTKAYEKSEE